MYINLFIIFLILSLSFRRSNVLGCGLVGASAPKDSNIIMEKIKTLLLFNERRGTDSSGYYPNSEGGITKLVGAVSDTLLPSTEIDELETNYFIGHVRSKTSGSISKESAHPFEYEVDGVRVVGAHNGTLYNWNALMRYYEYNANDANIDSKFLFFHLASYYKDKRIFTELDGGTAVIFTDDDNTLYVWRNKQRDLFRGTLVVDGVKQMYISSIENSLKMIGCTDTKAFCEEYLYVIRDGKVISQKPIKNKPLTSTEINNKINERDRKRREAMAPAPPPETKIIEMKPEDVKDGTKEAFAFTDYDNEDLARESSAWPLMNQEERAKLLSNLSDEIFDNYPSEEEQYGPAPREERQDDESALGNHIDAIPSHGIDVTTLDEIESIIGTGMSTERLFLLLKCVGMGISNLSDEMKRKASTRGDVIERLDQFSNFIYEQLLNSIKRVDEHNRK